MPRVTIHVEPAGGLGGAQIYGATLAESLSEANDVTLIHHMPGLSVEWLSKFSGCCLDRVRTIFAPPRDEQTGFRTPLHYRIKQRRYGKALSSRADIFFTITHALPPYCFARTGVMVSLFPMTSSREQWPFISRGHSLRSRLAEAAWKGAWRAHFANYQHPLSISEYSAAWTDRRWGIPCKVLYPPVSDAHCAGPKQQEILNLGRFASGPVSKHQVELMGAFRRISAVEKGWRFACLGSADDSTEGRSYLDAVIHESLGQDADVVIAPPRAVVEDHLSRASILWHAAGLGDDIHSFPERAEHFGIVTAEAMSYGCVPVVFDGGGQREIVEDGVSGFLCRSLEDFEHRTVELMRRPDLLRRMGANAIAQSRRFGRDEFRRRVLALVPELTARSAAAPAERA